jgi:putative tricarboxylic transport membrane protein
MAERRLSRTPERFGNGAIEGVAGPETANNAFVNAALIPLFTLGIPTTATIAVLQGAFMMHGVLPGPLLFRDHPDIIWPVIASLVVGNAMLLVLNVPLVGIWVSLLRIPYSLLYVLILIFTLVGAFTISGSSYGLGVMIFFGVVGYILRKVDFPLAPLVLTFVLGPLIERALRASLQMSNGDVSILFGSWTSMVLLAAACVVLLSTVPILLPFNIGYAREDNE